jgi:hypothetical protein
LSGTVAAAERSSPEADRRDAMMSLFDEIEHVAGD